MILGGDVLRLLLVLAALPVAARAQNPLVRMGEIRKAISAGDTATAFVLLDNLTPFAPDHPNLVLLRAHANGRAQLYAEARREIKRLLRWDPRYARAALRDTSVAALRAEFSAVD